MGWDQKQARRGGDAEDADLAAARDGWGVTLRKAVLHVARRPVVSTAAGTAILVGTLTGLLRLFGLHP